MKEPVRHLAGSAGPRVAVAAFTESVEIWDVVAVRRLSAFPTGLDFGGRRLCLLSDGSLCLTGAFHRFGVAAYRSEDGTPKWSRRDVRRVQYISTSHDDRRVYVGLASGPLVVLDTANGSTIEKISGVRRVFEGGSKQARLLDRPTPVVEVEARAPFSVPRTTFGILDVAFGPDSLCISESTGPTRCLDLTSGAEIWRYVPPRGQHLLSLAYCESAKSFVGVSCEYVETAAKFLLQFGPKGEAVPLAQLGQPVEATFCLSGEAVISSDGQLFESSTGKLLRGIPFEEAAES